MTTAQPPRQDTAASFLDGSRLYARGSKSLQAELEVLRQRNDDTPFIDGLRQTQAQLNLLKELDPAATNFKIFHIDGEVNVPLKPRSPNKSLYLAIGLFLGLAIGFLIAMIRSGILRGCSWRQSLILSQPSTSWKLFTASSEFKSLSLW
jgi:chain length determinant protein (polysaccharide antigen chain regulator)